MSTVANGIDMDRTFSFSSSLLPSRAIFPPLSHCTFSADGKKCCSRPGEEREFSMRLTTTTSYRYSFPHPSFRGDALSYLPLPWKRCFFVQCCRCCRGNKLSYPRVATNLASALQRQRHENKVGHKDLLFAYCTVHFLPQSNWH